MANTNTHTTVGIATRRAGRLAAAAVATAGVGLMTAGCGMGGLLTSGPSGGGGWFGTAAPKVDTRRVNEAQLLDAAKAGAGVPPPAISAEAGGCPRFQVAARDGTLTIYESGRVGDGLAIMHRGEITKTARECTVEPGRVTVKYGFAGRVLLGPRGRGGLVKLPLVVSVVDAKRERVAADAVKVDVDVALDKPIGYFSGSRTVSFVIPEGTRPGEFEMQIGFDRNVPGAG